MSSIRETVARAICRAGCDRKDCPCHYADGDQEIKEATAAITAFLKAAAEQGWHMRPDEATEEMLEKAAKTPKMQGVNSAMTLASVHGFHPDCGTDWHDSPIADAYRAMNQAAPEFEHLSEAPIG